MALTLADMAVQASDKFDAGMLKRFGETSALGRMLPYRRISGERISYRIPETLPGVESRRVNEAYTESTGTWSSRQEDISIVGGEFFVDRALRRFHQSGGDAIDLIAEQAMLKARALAREIERLQIEGDKLVNPDEMMGLRPRLTGTQVTLAGSGGATLTVAMIETLIDNVSDSIGRRVLLMNKASRNKFNSLLLAATGTARINYDSVDALGKRVQTYDGVPIVVIEDDWDASTILDAEDPGDGTADTYSIYCVALSTEEGVHGIVNGDGPFVDCYRVTKETETGPPGEKWRCETYVGMAIPHPRAAHRLRGVLL